MNYPHAVVILFPLQNTIQHVSTKSTPRNPQANSISIVRQCAECVGLYDVPVFCFEIGANGGEWEDNELTAKVITAYFAVSVLTPSESAN